MSYYGGNIPPPEKSGMYPPGSYSPAAGTYLPQQGGLPSGAPQPAYPSMSPQYPSMPAYTSASAYGSVQPGYAVTTQGLSPAGFQAMAYPTLASLSNPSYPSSQGYLASVNPAAYQPGQMSSQSPYGSTPLPPTNPLYQGASYNGMSMPTSGGLGYPMPMYPASSYSAQYPGTSPYGPPFN